MKVENTRTTLPNRFVHRAAYYSSSDEALALAAPIAKRALSRNQPVALLSSPEVEAGVRELLDGAPGLICLAMQEPMLRSSGQTVVTRRARELRELTDWADAVEVIIEHGANHSDVARSAWVEAEAAFNVALATLPITMTCLYPSDVAAARNAVRYNHPHLVDGAGAARENSEVQLPAQVLANFPAPAPAALGMSHREMGFTPWQLIELRKAVAEAASAAGLDAERAEDFVLAVNEVASNAVEHGYGVGELRIWQRTGQLICEIHDKGLLTDPLPGLRPPHPSNARGRGLWIARQLCDLLHVWSDSGGTHVRLQTGSA
ncbi:MAG TPA: anti-sigma factor RsbA family regulatory protein [Pseudonocardia sp.]|nr:anti-sigma factor RsbA family regulatory protein [Pseudonocardia sp.]